MLTIFKITGARAGSAVEYFTDVEVQRSRGDYYAEAKSGEAAGSPGRWLGKLVRTLGLIGEVTVEQLVHILDGRHPLSGGRLVPFKKDRVAAHDMTFSAPKSVSVVWSLAPERLREAVEAAQAHAVETAMDYGQRMIPVVRRGRGGYIVETAAELMGMAFTHHTSRQTVTQATNHLPPDPQVHTHVLVPFARRHDGRIVAINSAALFRGRKEMEAVYHNALATELAGLGFEIERGTGRGKRYFEVKGIPAALCADMSNRHAEIEKKREERVAEFRERYGRDPDEVELRDLSIRSRMPKGQTYYQPVDYWRALGAAHGVSETDIEALCTGSLPSPEEGRGQVAAELLGESGLTKEQATFTGGGLRIAAFQRAAGVISAGEAERTVTGLMTNNDVVWLGDDVWTTREIVQLERGVRTWRDERHDLPPPPHASASDLWAAIRAQQTERDVTLSGEQVTALRAMVRDRFVAVTGEAGSGKGAVLAAAAHVWRRQDRRVFAVAVAGATAQRLATDLGDGAEAMTLDGLVTRLRHGRLELREDDVIALDEAGMIDTRRWAAFADAVKDRATVVALGDGAQLSPISAGGLWSFLSAGGPQLREVHRTKLEWERDAWQQLRRGDAQGALAAYGKHDRLHVMETRSDALEAAVEAWDKGGRGGLIITDASNAERDIANRQAQQRKQAAGELGGDGVSLSPGSPRFSAGDRVIFRRQWRIGGGAARVENGTTGTVVDVDVTRRSVRVRTDEPVPRALDVIADGQPSLLGLTYAAHVYKAQGATVDHVYVVAGGWQTHREALYVACSRSRSGTTLFTDRESLQRNAEDAALTELAVRGSRSRAKVAASAYNAEATRPRPRRRRARRVLTSRRPLIDVYRRRQELRAVRALYRRQREEAAAIEHQRRRQKRYPEETGRPVAGGVPGWVARAFEEVTGTRYAGRNAI